MTGSGSGVTNSAANDDGHQIKPSFMVSSRYRRGLHPPGAALVVGLDLRHRNHTSLSAVPPSETRIAFRVWLCICISIPIRSELLISWFSFRSFA